VPPIPAPGTEVWLKRGYIQLTPVTYRRIVAKLLGLEAPVELYPERTAGWLSPAYAVNDAIMNDVDIALDGLGETALLAALACDAADAACAERASTEFARHVWRRPIEAAEAEGLRQPFTGAAAGSEVEALREIVRSILTSPTAYYLPALGRTVGASKFELDPLELAGILALGVTGQPPDTELLDAAEAGDLDLSEQLERLLAAPEARESLGRRIRGWFGVAGPEALWLYEDEPELARAMVEETRRFIDDVVFDSPQPLSTLLTADFSFVDAQLSELYGLPARSDFARVELPERRRGIPGHASYLTAKAHGSDPSYAGRAVVPLVLLCDPLPAPPSDVVVTIPDIEPNLTRRQRYESATSSAACQSCHQVMNPIGFAFDHFDGRGGYVTMDDGLPIDGSGRVMTFNGLEFEFADGADLMRQIAATSAYAACFVRNASGWLVTAGVDDPALLDYVARARVSGSDGEALGVIREFVASDHFRFRSD
jgi:hypothetical protein